MLGGSRFFFKGTIGFKSSVFHKTKWHVGFGSKKYFEKLKHVGFKFRSNFFRNVDSSKLTVVSFYEVHWFHFQNGVKFKFLRLLIQTFWQEICFQVLSLFKRTYFSSCTLCDLIALQISKDSRNELVSNFHGEQTQGVWKVRKPNLHYKKKFKIIIFF